MKYINHNAKNHSILVIDDEIHIVEAVTELLRDDGYTTYHALTGVDGLLQFREKQPSIVIVDVRLPDMNGIDVLKEIKRSTSLCEVIIITGHGDLETSIEALRARASDFVLKPITLNALEVAVDRARKRIMMEQSLKDYTERLEDLVQEKVAELRIAHARLEILDQAKQMFLSLISHELRTPLTSLSASKLIPKDRLNPDEAQFVDIIISGYERLNTFVERALKYVELLSKNDLQPFTRLDFSTIIKSSVQDSAALKQKHSVEIETSFDVDEKIDVNVKEIRFVLDEVLHNALKNSHSKGKVQVVTERSASTISCKVIDHGRGIDPRFLESIFDIFTIADVLHHKEGTGLSLAISRLILALHGGTIEAESMGQYQGATFTISLPIARPAKQE